MKAMMFRCRGNEPGQNVLQGAETQSVGVQKSTRTKQPQHAAISLPNIYFLKKKTFEKPRSLRGQRIDPPSDELID